MDVRAIIEVNEPALLQDADNATTLLTEHDGLTLVETQQVVRLESVDESPLTLDTVEEFNLFIDESPIELIVDNELLNLISIDSSVDVEIVDNDLLMVEQCGTTINEITYVGTKVYIQPDGTNDPGDYLWIQTGLPDDGFTFWFNEA